MTFAASIFILLALFSCCRCESNYTYKFYPCYHMAPRIDCQTKVGWMNDPNGLCFYKNEYHLFYQYNPYSSVDPGIAHWGHAVSPDLITWVHKPIALLPDKTYDRDGVFSGSALIKNNKMYLYYTGNVNFENQTPDHQQQQALAVSEDGETFTKFQDNPIIIGADRQPNIRDPKVWKDGDSYFMVLGNSFKNNTLGRVLLYTSLDKISWKEVSVLDESDGFLGYMWECPDFFELNSIWILMFSPQGVDAVGDKFRNLYSCGYITGYFDRATYQFTPKTKFVELDHGHDFYATQTMIDEQGRRIVVAWLDMWKQDYPEGPDGFTGQMTLFRSLTLDKDGHIIQQPIVPEEAIGNKLHEGYARSGTKINLERNAAKIEIFSPRRKNFELILESEGANDTVRIKYNYNEGTVALDRGGDDGVRRTKYRPDKFNDFHMTIFVDSSSIEIFYGKGEKTMSSRFFPKGLLYLLVAYGSHARCMYVNSMKRTVISAEQSLKRCT